MEDRDKITEYDSLRIINQMIADAKNEIRKGSGTAFILWGYIIVIASLLHFVVCLAYPNALLGIPFAKATNIIWIGFPSLGILISIILGFKTKREVVVTTYASRIVNSVWIGFAISIAFIVFLFPQYIYQAISIVYVFALFITLRIFNWKELWLSVIICIICTILYKFVPMTYYPLLQAICMTCGNIIPGHILNRAGNRESNRKIGRDV